MTGLGQQFGLLRSLVIYYGAPLRRKRLARFYSQFIKPGDLCFDIGAHVGDRLQAWSRLGARSIGVEPQPHCMRLLRRWYGRDPAITLVEAAIDAAPGEQTLFISRRTPTVSTLSRPWLNTVSKAPDFATVVWDRAIEVAVTTLDALIEKYGEPAFCKIDVEGYELEVLQGLSRPIGALSFEYLSAALDSVPKCLERLNQLGDYEYNWSPGESLRLQAPLWLTSQAMLARLERLAAAGGSGDIYACLAAS